MWDILSILHQLYWLPDGQFKVSYLNFKAIICLCPINVCLLLYESTSRVLHGDPFCSTTIRACDVCTCYCVLNSGTMDEELPDKKEQTHIFPEGISVLLSSVFQYEIIKALGLLS